MAPPCVRPLRAAGDGWPWRGVLCPKYKLAFWTPGFLSLGLARVDEVCPGLTEPSGSCGRSVTVWGCRWPNQPEGRDQDNKETARSRVVGVGGWPRRAGPQTPELTRGQVTHTPQQQTHAPWGLSLSPVDPRPSLCLLLCHTASPELLHLLKVSPRQQAQQRSLSLPRVTRDRLCGSPALSRDPFKESPRL